MTHETDHIKIYFGNASGSVHATEEQRTYWGAQKNILDSAPFDVLKSSLDITKLIFDHQVHGCTGRIINTHQSNNLRSWNFDGDFLITQDTSVGIGVLTADCLPIVLHDPINNVIAVIHAGWRGAVQHIAIKALETMHTQFKTNPAYIYVYFGPCIGPCCYAVGSEVIKAVTPYENVVLETRNNTIYFDLTTYNKLLLLSAGVPQQSFDSTHSACTLCSDSYCSYRRNATQQRQLTVACLKAI